MIESLVFYQSQILFGVLLGAAAAALGVFVLLQRMAFFGVTLSQAATCAVAAALAAGIHNEAVTLALTIAFMLPFFLLRQSKPANMEALLAFGLVFFSSLAHMLLSFSGAAQTHLVTAYFGNILTSDPNEWKHTTVFDVIILVVLAFIFRSLVAVSFDRDHAFLSGIRARAVDFTYFVLLSLVLGTTITHMGSFFTLAHLTVPGLFALALVRSIPAAIIVALIFSAVGTAGGFFLSLFPVPMAGEEIHLPTSSTIVLVLCLGLIPALIWKGRK